MMRNRFFYLKKKQEGGGSDVRSGFAGPRKRKNHIISKYKGERKISRTKNRPSTLNISQLSPSDKESVGGRTCSRY